jgi:hypothetical protein
MIFYLYYKLEKINTFLRTSVKEVIIKVIKVGRGTTGGLVIHFKRKY